MNNREVGSSYEQKAAEYLRQKGYSILERNFRCRLGEIDLIGRDGAYLCFIEVKFRSGIGKGYPAEAITPAKIRRITKTAQYFMLMNKLAQNTPCRFDLVLILDNDITLIKNAFDAI